jgi:hypothetical protein
LAITSSEIFSALRWSNTKFFPKNLFSIPSAFTWRVYSIIPPSNWKTFLNPLCLYYADAFSQRMPPVQYINKFLSSLLSFKSS